MANNAVAHCGVGSHRAPPLRTPSSGPGYAEGFHSAHLWGGPSALHLTLWAELRNPCRSTDTPDTDASTDASTHWHRRYASQPNARLSTAPTQQRSADAMGTDASTASLLYPSIHPHRYRRQRPATLVERTHRTTFVSYPSLTIVHANTLCTDATTDTGTCTDASTHWHRRLQCQHAATQRRGHGHRRQHRYYAATGTDASTHTGTDASNLSMIVLLFRTYAPRQRRHTQRQGTVCSIYPTPVPTPTTSESGASTHWSDADSPSAARGPPGGGLLAGNGGQNSSWGWGATSRPERHTWHRRQHRHRYRRQPPARAAPADTGPTLTPPLPRGVP